MSLAVEIVNIFFNFYVFYTEQTGLPDLHRAAVIANGNWYYGKALEPMRGNHTFCCHLINIGPIYTK